MNHFEAIKVSGSLRFNVAIPHTIHLVFTFYTYVCMHIIRHATNTWSSAAVAVAVARKWPSKLATNPHLITPNWLVDPVNRQIIESHSTVVQTCAYGFDTVWVPTIPYHTKLVRNAFGDITQRWLTSLQSVGTRAGVSELVSIWANSFHTWEFEVGVNWPLPWVIGSVASVELIVFIMWKLIVLVFMHAIIRNPIRTTYGVNNKSKSNLLLI